MVGGVALACLLSLAARRERLSSCTKTSLLPSSLPRVNFSTEIALALEPAPFLVCGREFRGTHCLAQLLLLLGDGHQPSAVSRQPACGKRRLQFKKQFFPPSQFVFSLLWIFCLFLTLRVTGQSPPSCFRHGALPVIIGTYRNWCRGISLTLCGAQMRGRRDRTPTPIGAG